MRPEWSLLAVVVILFLYDLIAGARGRRHMHTVACILLAGHVLLNVIPHDGELDLFGGMYHTVPMLSVMKTILSAGTLLLVMQSRRWLQRPDTCHKQGEFYTLTLFTLLGMFFMMSAGHFLMFVIGLELASIPMACLVAFDKYKHHSAEAGAKYILSAMFSSGLMLYGLSFLYGTTGTLYFDRLPELITATPLQVAALVFFFAGVGFKISLVPFHLWTADVYEGAPTSVTTYLSVISKAAAAFTLFLVLVKVFSTMVGVWEEILCWLIVASITVGNLFAIRQENIKRFLAFSSISQAGYLVLGIMGGTPQGMSSTVFYALAYMIANIAVFGVVASVEQQTDGKVSIRHYDGLYRTNPKLAVVMTLALFSLGGIPPFAGFFSKFFIFMSAFEAGFHWLVFVALINTVISLYYYLLVVKALFINPNDHPIETFDSDHWMRASLVICTLALVVVGIASGIYDGIHAFAFGM